MAEALDPGAYVFEGLWTDWSKGNVRGLTITLCPTSATFLTNSLALFVTLAGGQLWTILRFSLHQRQAALIKRRDTPLHQQQITLRNATTNLATARLMWLILWRSRRQPSEQPLRAMWIGVFAIFHAALFMVAGTLSNKLIMSTGSTTGPSPVLSRSPHCGVWNETYYAGVSDGLDFTDFKSLTVSEQFWAKLFSDVQLSLSYAQDCYLQQPSESMSSICGTLKQPRLQWEKRTSPCPFSSDLCHKDSDGITFDTQTIDSFADLGINGPHSDRLTYRRSTDCVVLNGTNHVTGWDGSIADPEQPLSQNISYAYFGSSLNQGTDWTWSYSNFGDFYTNFTPVSTVPYQVNAQFGGIDFEPLPSLTSKSADLFLVFMGYTGRYFEPIDDPWFSAHQRHDFDTALAVGRTQYSRDSAISTLGCQEKHQFCTLDNVCTPWSGFDQLSENQRFNSTLSVNQNVTFSRMLDAVDRSSIYNIISGLRKSSTPLLANNATITASHVVSLPLPDNQWKLELEYWHSIAMANMQRTIVEWSTGSISPDPELSGGSYLVSPQTKGDISFCENLMILSTMYQSFSLVSIIVILVIGTSIIAVSLLIEDLAETVQKRFMNGSTALQDWNNDDMLRLSCYGGEGYWRPQPPPKDALSQPVDPRAHAWLNNGVELALRSTYPSEAAAAIAPNSRRASSQALPLERPTIPCFSYPSYSRGPQHQKQADSPESNRDSWVPISLNSYDAIIPETQARHILDQGFVRPTPEVYHIVQTTPEIRGVKLHKLPGKKGSWI